MVRSLWRNLSPLMILSRRLPILAFLAITAILPEASGAGVTITRGPYLQSLLGTSVVVVWNTGADSAGGVRWTDPDGVVRDALEGPPSRAHKVSIAGLIPGAIYRYTALDGGTAITEEFSFRTAPPPGEGTVKVAVAGDTGSGDANQLAVAAVIEGMRPDIFVQTGDINYIDDVDQAIFVPYRKILAETCFYPCMGNDDDPLQDWPGLFSLPFDGPREGEIYYSFDWGSAHFTAVDTQGVLEEGSPQRTWIEGDLAAARARRVPWLILFFHRAPYTVGRYSTGTLLTKTLEIRRLLTPLVDRFGVDLVLNGHDHNYQRTYPVKGGVALGVQEDPRYMSPGGAIYVVTGGGGRFLYNESPGSDHSLNRIFVKTFHAVELTISSSKIEARAISGGGKVIDSFSIEKGFIRGDADGNASIDLPDVVAVLEYIFRGAEGPSCLDRLDVNDDGEIDISDPIFLLFHMFAARKDPPPPFPDPGGDPTDDDIPCL